MTTWKVPLSELVFAEEDIRAVADTYRSGWLTMGPRTEQLEQCFARYTGARHAIAVTNGTAALHLSCLAVGLAAGDEVVVPSLTFVATADAVAYCGATPVFADVAGPARPWLSAAACRSAITERTRAILYVDYGGHPGDVHDVRDVCRERGLVLLEDAAHAAGSVWRGRHAGTFGLVGAFSLFSNKNWAIGEGGLVVTDDDTVAARVRLLRSHGMTAHTWDRHREAAPTYDVVTRGFNYRIDEARAALATARLRRLDDENALRSRLDARYRAELAGLDLTIALPPVEHLAPSHHLFTVVLPADADRDAFRRHLSRQGIQTSVHYPPVHRTTLYSTGQRLPVTDDYAARSVSLPMYAHLSDHQQDLVISGVREALAGPARPQGERRWPQV
jgi:dTDP-4-amino-4,6-dideoxygalactose transaminase